MGISILTERRFVYAECPSRVNLGPRESIWPFIFFEIPLGYQSNPYLISYEKTAQDFEYCEHITSLVMSKKMLPENIAVNLSPPAV